MVSEENEVVDMGVNESNAHRASQKMLMLVIQVSVPSWDPPSPAS